MTIDDVRRAIRQAGSQEALRLALGLRSRQVISRWLRVGRMPHWYNDKLSEYLAQTKGETS